MTPTTMSGGARSSMMAAGFFVCFTAIYAVGQTKNILALRELAGN
jgi:hypothetical protein